MTPGVTSPSRVTVHPSPDAGGQHRRSLTGLPLLPAVLPVLLPVGFSGPFGRDGEATLVLLIGTATTPGATAAAATKAMLATVLVLNHIFGDGELARWQVCARSNGIACSPAREIWSLSRLGWRRIC